MLKDCQKCIYYKRIVNIGQITMHHYCHFHESSYSFLKIQGKLEECHLLSARLKLNVSSGAE